MWFIVCISSSPAEEQEEQAFQTFNPYFHSYERLQYQQLIFHNEIDKGRYWIVLPHQTLLRKDESVSVFTLPLPRQSHVDEMVLPLELGIKVRGS